MNTFNYHYSERLLASGNLNRLDKFLSFLVRQCFRNGLHSTSALNHTLINGQDCGVIVITKAATCQIDLRKHSSSCQQFNKCPLGAAGPRHKITGDPQSRDCRSVGDHTDSGIALTFCDDEFTKERRGQLLCSLNDSSDPEASDQRCEHVAYSHS